MNAQTQAKLAEILDYARTGAVVYPFMFQPHMGRSNTVSAAIRHAKKEGLLVEAGKDGTGKPTYRMATPCANHAGTAAIN